MREELDEVRARCDDEMRSNSSRALIGWRHCHRFHSVNKTWL